MSQIISLGRRRRAHRACWARWHTRARRARRTGSARRECPAEAAQVMIGMMRMATMFATLIIGLIAGPAVSLNGSPTVSPVTDAACASEPLPPNAPSSMSFLALSHAPPPAVMSTAKKKPTTITPTAGGHEHREEEAHQDHPDEQAAEGPLVDDADDRRDGDRDERGQDHLPLGGGRHKPDRRRVLGLLRAF